MEPQSENASDGFDAGGSLQRDLLAPPSSEELRGIHGSLLSRHGRAVAGAAAAALIGGLLLAWLSGGAAPTPPADDAPAMAELDTPRSEPDSAGIANASGKPFARLRGPVPAAPDAAGEVARVAPAPAQAERRVEPRPAGVQPIRLERERSGTAAVSPPVAREKTSPVAERGSLDDLDEDSGEELSEDDFVDLRPAALRPGAGD